jgi:hypothetical protein
MVKCPFCQFENEEGALFCDQCKSDLGAGEPVAAGSAVGLAAASAIGAIPEAIPVAVAAEGSSFAAIAVAETLPADAVAEATIPVAIPMAEMPAAVVAVEAAPAFAPIDASPPVGATIESIAPAAPPTEEIPAATDVRPAEPAEKLGPDAKPALVVVRGLRIGAEYPLYEGENYVGRADDKAVDVDLEDQEAPDRIWSSRQHARITFQDGALTIEDLTSTNGTFVNRLRVHPGQKQALKSNDVVQIGTVQMRVKA